MDAVQSGGGICGDPGSAECWSASLLEVGKKLATFVAAQTAGKASPMALDAGTSSIKIGEKLAAPLAALWG